MSQMEIIGLCLKVFFGYWLLGTLLITWFAVVVCKLLANRRAAVCANWLSSCVLCLLVAVAGYWSDY